ncbi:hypothetical protein FRB90_001815 [Tulasnella sp. 427]|nr:hypothetical protein FRB90_001815 [Tulasnella sp. 427]
MPITTVEKLFLQAMMTRRIVSEKLAMELWRASVDAVRKVEPNVEALQEWGPFLGNVKHLLDPLGLDIKGTVIEDTGEKALILVNLVRDEIAQLATAYTATEITFFKQIVELIVMAPNESYSAGEITCLKEGLQLPAGMKVPLRHATKLLGSFAANGWLHKSKRSRYSLGPRAVVELRGYLTETYEEENLQICPTCSGLVFKVNVPVKEANVKVKSMHHVFKRRVGPETLVGEGAVRDERRDAGHRRRQDAPESEDEAGVGEGDEDEQHSSRKRKGKSDGRGTRSSQRRRQADEDDEDEALESEGGQDEAEDAAPMEENSEEEEAPQRRSRKRKH